MRNKHQAIVGHFLSLLNLYANQIVVIMIGMILSEITIFRCFYISNWSQMMALDEDFVTIICIEINCIITLLFIVVNFGTQQYLVNYFYQASRNLFGLTGPLMKLYPKITFWYMNNYTMITYIDSDYIRFRFIKFPAMAIYSILIGGGITLAILRLQNWFVLKRKFKINPIQENGYNTQSKNPIILNVKGKFRFYHIFY